MITTSCSACGAVHEVADALAGRTGRCRCGAMVRIPAADPVATTAAAASSAGMPVEQVDGPLLPIPAALALCWDRPAFRRSAIAVITAASLAATAWLLHDPVLDGNPYLAATQRRPQPPQAVVEPHLPLWRLTRPDGGGCRLVATWEFAAAEASANPQLHWALAEADILAFDVNGSGSQVQPPVNSLYSGPSMRRLRRALPAAHLDWSQVREQPPQRLRQRILEQQAEGGSLSRRYGLRQRLEEFARDRGTRIVGLDDVEVRAAVRAGNAVREAQALLAVAESVQAVPAALTGLTRAWSAGDLERFAGDPWCELLDPLPPAARAAQRQRLADAIVALCGRSARPLIAIDAIDLCGDGNVRQLLEARGFRCQPLRDDPFIEFPRIASEILRVGDEGRLRPEWLAAWIRREPARVRNPQLAELLRRWSELRDFHGPVRAALAEALPPITPADGEAVRILGLWQLPGASTVLPGLEPRLRPSAAQSMLASDAAQDWPLVVAELGGLRSEELVRLALTVPAEGAYQALRQRLAAPGAIDDAGRRLMLSHLAAPGSPSAVRREDLIGLAGDAAAVDVDEAWLLDTARKQSSGFHDWANRPLWTQVGAERWRRWWRERSVDRAILTLAARTGAQRDPTTPLGAIAVAALEEGGEVREQVLRQLRLIAYDWLFLLRHWDASAAADARTRCEKLLTEIDAQWPWRIAEAYVARGMLSDEHTRPMARLVAQRPACLGQILGAKASHIAADGSASPCKEVMMCYEFGVVSVGPALALAEDAQATQVARDNAFLLLLVIKQEPPPDCAAELPRITAALERLQRLPRR